MYDRDAVELALLAVGAAVTRAAVRVAAWGDNADDGAGSCPRRRQCGWRRTASRTHAPTPFTDVKPAHP